MASVNGGDARLRVLEVVAVEGLHDRQAVDAAVEADVWVLGGDRISRRTLAELSRALTARGVIVLTDPDGAGERIRRRLDAALPGCRHAYLTREDARGPHGIGVEHASRQAITAALAAVRRPPGAANAATAGVADESTDRGHSRFALADLAACGLAGAVGAEQKRLLVGEQLAIGAGNGKAFVRKLNVLCVTQAEWEEALAACGILPPDRT